MPITWPFLSPPKRSISQSSDASSKHNINPSQCQRDYRDKTRILFNGAWDLTGSLMSHPMIEWYRLQPHRQFRTIQYCKEEDGAQHEYILILFQDSDGHPVDSYCRLERGLATSHQTETIGVDGTEAVDFIQTFDSPPPESLSHDDGHPELVEQLTFPCAFDLLDILSICYGIHDHQKTRPHTLQQSNCYFLYLAVVLCLARRAINWENDISRDHINSLQTKISERIKRMHSPGDFSLWSILFGVNNPESQPRILKRVIAKVSGQTFKAVARKMLRSVFWHDQDVPVDSQAGMKSQLQNMASKLVDPSLKNVSFNRDPGLHGVRGWLNDMSMGVLQPEIIRICQVALFKNEELDEQNTECTNRHRRYFDTYIKQAPITNRLNAAPAYLIGSLAVVYLQLGFIPAFILFSRDFYNHAGSVPRKGAREMIQKPVAIAKTIVYSPKTLYKSIRMANVNARQLYHHVLGGYVAESKTPPEGHDRLFPDFDLPDLALRLLSEGLNTFSQRHGECGADELRHEAMRAIEYFREAAPPLRHYGMDRIWKVSFAQSVGDEIVRAILDVVVRSGGEQCQFEWMPGPRGRTKNTKPESMLLSHNELQTILRERIALVCKKEIRGTASQRHIPFTKSLKQSQEEIEESIATIWRKCGPLMTVPRIDAESLVARTKEKF